MDTPKTPNEGIISELEEVLKKFEDKTLSFIADEKAKLKSLFDDIFHHINSTPQLPSSASANPNVVETPAVVTAPPALPQDIFVPREKSVPHESTVS